MAWDDSLGNMLTLDRWRDEIGLVYDMETPARMAQTFAGRELTVRAKHNMKYGRIAGVDKPVSRIVMGVDNQPNAAHAFAVFDYFFERGGNCFDTAYIYCGGKSERFIGEWIKARNLRDQIVLIGKGAHTPFCNPKDLTRQLLESLRRMQTDRVDIYLMHRDNPEIPVGEFIDVLNEHKTARRIGAFGGSNWSIERVRAANEYAQAKGLAGFSVISNNFSLARMVDPVWPGCISASDAESRAWLTQTQTPLLAWSSQARGFFTERSNPTDRSDEELSRCWYSDDNFRRKERAVELARQRKVSPLNIALAYVLNQPFPTFPLIGPRTLAETRTSLPALDIELSPEELRWLNLEDESLDQVSP
jgi:aryl-alcohol dehydrogenase-like predicted oxidoreductase